MTRWEHTGDSANIAYYVQVADQPLWCEVLHHARVFEDLRPPTYTITVYRLYEGELTSFTHQLAGADALEAPVTLPADMVGRLVEEALA